MRYHPRYLPVTSNDGPDQLFSIAAPILAGFSVTLVGVLVPLNPPSLVPFREAAMLALAGAMGVFLGAMRYAIIGRMLRISDAEAVQTWADPTQAAEALEVYRREHDKLTDASRLLFGVACLAFGIGVILMLVPSSFKDVSYLRLATIAMLTIGTLAQLSQMISRRIPVRRLPGWLDAILTPDRRIASKLPPASARRPL